MNTVILRGRRGPRARSAPGLGLLAASLAVGSACAEPSGAIDPGADSGSPSLADSGPGPSDAGVSDLGELDSGTPDLGVTPDAGPPLKVLFVGNSYTAANDLPGTVQALAAASAGPPLAIEAIAVPGARLADHWLTSGAKERIMVGDLDRVVLQGQSVEPIYSPADFDLNAKRFADLLDEVGSEGVWFATWARRDLEGDPLLIAQMLDDRYRAAAAHHGDRLARVGTAWEIWLYTHTDVPLFSSDNTHPNPAGTLLSACVIYQALTGTTATVPDPAPFGIPREVATALCALSEGGVPCGPGEALCDGACRPFDPQNCGGCGVTCDPGDPCRRGRCGCDQGRTGCELMCVDTETDPNHCGGCGHSCEGAACVQGECSCPLSGRVDLPFPPVPPTGPGCDRQLEPGSVACNAASHQFCVDLGGALDCFTSGFGPPTGHAPTVDAVMCVAGDLQATTYTALSQLVAGCDGVTERQGQGCTTAISRYCAGRGAVSGFGPLASQGDDLTVTCVSTATVVETDLVTLSGFASRCEPDPVNCGIASWNYCNSLGYAAGFGPVEVVGDVRSVVCLP